MPSAAPGKGFAECKVAFAGCIRHPAKRLNPVVTYAPSFPLATTKHQRRCGREDEESKDAATVVFFLNYLIPSKASLHNLEVVP